MKLAPRPIKCMQFAAGGVLLGLLAPAGALLLQAARHGAFPDDAFCAGQWRDHGALYLYMAIATPLSLGACGAWMGCLVTNLRQVSAQAEAASLTDPLTGLPNRRHLDSRLREAVSHAERTREALACLAIDLDHLKAINDRHGHGLGDETLYAVARELRSTLRTGDFLARTGGDEFVALLPDTSFDDATVVAERLVEAVRGIRVRGVAPTLSIGLAIRADDADPGNMYGDADRALYQAKAEGRDGVVAFSPSRTKPPAHAAESGETASANAI